MALLKTAEELRQETARIRRSIELMRESKREDLVSTGLVGAEAALKAMTTAFGLNQGDDPTQLMNARKRSTLIAAAANGTVAPTRSSSAAVSATTNAPVATSSAAAVSNTRSYVGGGGGRAYANQMLE